MPPQPRHPAKYSEPILAALQRLVRADAKASHYTGEHGYHVLDPFAGVGRVHQLEDVRRRIVTLGVEIEPEWADCHRRTICADSLLWLPQTPSRYDAVVTSPTYGNRMADHHEARDGSRRRSYRHDLGRMPTPGSSATLHWGPDYWAFHALAYRLIYDVLVPGGLFLLNVSDFYARKALVPAVSFHRGAALGAGFDVDGRDVAVPTHRLNGVGTADTAARADAEYILRLRKPPTEVLV